ncbi:protein of unknown function [uncultured Woeseiaceae bacterium]|uniref:Uncharacterized protein n=1 Tax=uncultured Woeseiaceae bacterium TaxID=1983305 RepID=A0A7D9D1Y9_9GAMM|nr:protein of unknown function [uncultured Woeseiaceae bacterium]
MSEMICESRIADIGGKKQFMSKIREWVMRITICGQYLTFISLFAIAFLGSSIASGQGEPKFIAPKYMMIKIDCHDAWNYSHPAGTNDHVAVTLVFTDGQTDTKEKVPDCSAFSDAYFEFIINDNHKPENVDYVTLSIDGDDMFVIDDMWLMHAELDVKTFPGHDIKIRGIEYDVKDGIVVFTWTRNLEHDNRILVCMSTDTTDGTSDQCLPIVSTDTDTRRWYSGATPPTHMPLPCPKDSRSVDGETFATEFKGLTIGLVHYYNAGANDNMSANFDVCKMYPSWRPSGRVMGRLIYKNPDDPDSSIANLSERPYTKPLFRFWSDKNVDNVATTNEDFGKSNIPGVVNAYKKMAVAGHIFVSKPPNFKTLSLDLYFNRKTNDYFAASKDIKSESGWMELVAPGGDWVWRENLGWILPPYKPGQE